MTTSRYHIINNAQPHFLTCTVSEWQPVFAYAQYRDIVIESLSFLIRTRDLRVHAYVIMENHLHLIASSDTLEKQIARFRSYTARRIIDLLKVSSRSTILELCGRKGMARRADRTHAFWASGVHPESIRDHNMLTQKIVYIHNNPVRRGYVDDATHWRYSSARIYRGFPGELDIEILGM
ncbi:MAG: transposase [Bacteroidota bacterium]|nr:transposase [Bacteroidota bacterium]